MWGWQETLVRRRKRTNYNDLQLVGKNTAAWGGKSTNGVEQAFKCVENGPNDGWLTSLPPQLTKRVINSPAKMAAAPAIWFVDTGSPSQIAATMIATIGVM